MQQKKEMSKGDKTLVLVGGINGLFAACKFFSDAIEAIRESSVLRLFSPVTPAYGLAWAAVNVAMLWQFHAIGRERRWVQNTATDGLDSGFGIVKGVGNFFQNMFAPPKTLLPSSEEVKIRMELIKRKGINAGENIEEGAAVVYDTIEEMISPKR